MPFFPAFLNTFDFTRYKEVKNRLAYYCPWSFFAGDYKDGIVLLKAGALMRAYTFTCPDLGSASAETINSVSYNFNEAVKRLDDGWGIQFESQRRITNEYPGSAYPVYAPYLIDMKRKDMFVSQKEHFANQYYLIFTQKLKNEIYSKAAKLLYRKKSGDDEGYYNLEQCRKEIQLFVNQTEACIAYLTGQLYVSPLNNDETASFIHSAASMRIHAIHTPNRPMLLDHYITDDSLDIADTLKLGDYYIPVIAVRDFPSQTYPAMFSSLNSSGIEYRWSTRWIGQSKQQSGKDLMKYQKRFYGSRKSWGTALAESLGNFESGREDPAASAFEQDTNSAIVELMTDRFSFGYYTANVLVWDKNYDVAQDKARYIVSLINSSGFTAKIETANAFNAFRSMMPGDMCSNIRRPIISSGNLSHIIPLSSVWTGMRRNNWTEECFECPAPLLTCGTSNLTPFFLNLNVGDVGHTMIFGPTGGGKSTFLCLLEIQFLKYKNASVIILDKDKSARSVTMAVGGLYAEPGGENAAFQPLRDLDSETDLSWAAEFIKLLLEMQRVACTAGMSNAVTDALKQMKTDKKPERRTLTTFSQYVNYTDPNTRENTIRTGIQPYTLSGEYGRIFDADSTSLRLAKFVMIEMGTLMKLGPQAVTPALMFIFKYIEKVYTTPQGTPTGGPTLLVLDEAWVFLDNDYFAKKIEEWLLTLRKYKVFCVFATQEVARVAKSRLSTTILSQCLTKFYLADRNAHSEVTSGYYRQFGLDDSEISALAHARMKRDYLYKSPLGTRMFELALDELQLAILSPDHRLLDCLEQEYGKNAQKQLVFEILRRKGISGYMQYLKKGGNL
ncbi:MAG: AAA family ATPase [Treponema sp.]|jgi:type IV secretion system protein VirB4|nr:AAA family ATPase [Treponema sp.]